MAVVVTIYTAGAASGMFAATGATVTGAAGATGALAVGTSVLAGTAGGISAGGMIAAAAIGGAVGSVASQAVLIAGGVQDKFDWKGVALGAVGAGVTAGLGASGLASALPKSLGEVGRAAVMGGVNSAVNQTIAVATGLQDSFDWKGVAISAVSAGAGEFVSGKLNTLGERLDWNPNITQHVSRFGAGVVAGTVSAAARGNLSSQVLTSVGLDALAATVGAGIAESAQARSANSAIGAIGSDSQEARASASFGARADQLRTNELDIRRFNAQPESAEALDAVRMVRNNDMPIRDWSGDRVLAEYVPEPEWSPGVDHFLRQLVTESVVQNYERSRLMDFGLSTGGQTLRTGYRAIGEARPTRVEDRSLLSWLSDRLPGTREINFIKQAAGDVAVAFGLAKDGVGLDGHSFKMHPFTDEALSNKDVQDARISTLLLAGGPSSRYKAVAHAGRMELAEITSGALYAKRGFPSSGIDALDRLFVDLPQYKKMVSALGRRGVVLIDDPSRLGTSERAFVTRREGGLEIVYDSKATTFLDLLHESRHVMQIQRADASGVLGERNIMKRDFRPLLERGAYEYELRLGAVLGRDIGGFGAGYREQVRLSMLVEKYNRGYENKLYGDSRANALMKVIEPRFSNNPMYMVLKKELDAPVKNMPEMP